MFLIARAPPPRMRLNRLGQGRIGLDQAPSCSASGARLTDRRAPHSLPRGGAWPRQGAPGRAGPGAHLTCPTMWPLAFWLFTSPARGAGTGSATRAAPATRGTEHAQSAHSTYTPVAPAWGRPAWLERKAAECGRRARWAPGSGSRAPQYRLMPQYAMRICARVYRSTGRPLRHSVRLGSTTLRLLLCAPCQHAVQRDSQHNTACVGSVAPCKHRSRQSVWRNGALFPPLPAFSRGRRAGAGTSGWQTRGRRPPRPAWRPAWRPAPAAGSPRGWAPRPECAGSCPAAAPTRDVALTLCMCRHLPCGGARPWRCARAALQRHRCPPTRLARCSHARKAWRAHVWNLGNRRPSAFL